jgi:hypothetical protein
VQTQTKYNENINQLGTNDIDEERFLNSKKAEKMLKKNM